MNILFINQTLGADIIKAICWTLVHSLWQGLLLAIAGGSVILLTRKSNPATRYKLLTTLFLFFVFTATYTFIVQLAHPDLPQAASAATLPESVSQSHSGFSTPNDKAFRSLSTDFSINFTYYFDKQAPIIVLAWFIILTARLLKMISGLMYINKIRTIQVYDPVPYWKTRARQLQSYLKINKHVQLLESGIIKVPVAVGWLKPVILIPAGLFTHLSEEQLEAILLHELAHIKRKDYFVNLLQSLAETIFLFNPAVLWISSLIREERESCCDDMAIAVTKNKSKFINALVSFQEYNCAEYAISFAGRKNQLLNRVQRIIYNTNSTLNSIEKAGFISCCLVIILLSAFAIPKHEKHNFLNKILNIKNNPGVDALVAEQEATLGAEPTDENNQVSDKSASVVSITKAFNNSYLVRSSRIRHPQYPENIKPEIQKVDTTPIIKTLLHINNVKINSNKNFIFKDSVKLDVAITIDTLVSLSKLDIKLAPIIIKSLKFSTNYNYNIDSSYFKESYKQDSSYKSKLHDPKPQPRVKPEPNVKQELHQNPLTDPVIVALIKSKVVEEPVITSRADFYYILDNKEIIVQCVRQAEALYQKLRAKYIIPTGKTTRSYVWKN